jgi:hypothetical protein
MSLATEIVKLIGHDRWTKTQILIMIPAMLIAFGMEYYKKHEAEKLREQNLVYEKQLEVLDNVQSSIDNLKLFVARQKTQLQEQQAVVEKLKSEQSVLKPVVEANKEVVEALFKLQAQHNSANVWVDRAIGFLLGIVGSLIASIIYTAVRRNRHNKQIQQTADASAD